MLQGKHSPIRLTFLMLPFVLKNFVLSILERPFYTGFTVQSYLYDQLYIGPLSHSLKESKGIAFTYMPFFSLRNSISYAI